MRSVHRPNRPPRRRRAFGASLLAAATCLAAAPARQATAPASQTQSAAAPERAAAATLDETRLAMQKWIETQQILSREKKDWQQSREILVGRVELVRREVGALEEKIAEARSGVGKSDTKRDELLAEKARLEAASARLATVIGAMEGEVKRLLPLVPAPLAAKLEPLRQRIPEDPASARVSVAERLQNVLGILNELNAANREIAVHYEVHEMADGRPAEVRAIYVGLAQAYWVSARGEAGIGRATGEGWRFEPAPEIAGDVTTALEILQGKHSPAFVPLPVTLQ